MVGDDPAISESEPRCEQASLCPLTLGTGEEAFSMQGQWPEEVGVEARVELRNINSPRFSLGDEWQAGREASALKMRGSWGWCLMGWILQEGQGNCTPLPALRVGRSGCLEPGICVVPGGRSRDEGCAGLSFAPSLL